MPPTGFEDSKPDGVVMVLIGVFASLIGLIDTTSNRVSGSTDAPDAGRNCCPAATTGTIAITNAAALCLRIRTAPNILRWAMCWLLSDDVRKTHGPIACQQEQ